MKCKTEHVLTQEQRIIICLTPVLLRRTLVLLFENAVCFRRFDESNALGKPVFRVCLSNELCAHRDVQTWQMSKKVAATRPWPLNVGDTGRGIDNIYDTLN